MFRIKYLMQLLDLIPFTIPSFPIPSLVLITSPSQPIRVRPSTAIQP